MFFLRCWIVLFLSFHAHGQTLSPILIEGWSEADQTRALNKTFGNDPVIGRLTCPSMTRLHLKNKKSQSLIASKVQAISKTHWKYTLRKGIFWWDETPVTIEDFQNFLTYQITKKNLIHQVEIKKTDDLNIDLHWKQPPVFGPFFTNGQPFYKTDTAHPLGFQCVGNYKPDGKNWKHLLPNTGYKVPRRELLFINTQKSSSPHLRFWTPSQLKLEKEHLQNPPLCKHHVSLHGITLLRWNPQSSLLADKDLRSLLSHVLPRRTLARVGAADLAQPSYSVIPPQHPGSPKDIKPKTLTEIANALDAMGYTKNHPDHSRKTPSGHQMSLSIKTPIHNILTQVLRDNLHAVGIESRFDQEGFDLSVESLRLPWPDLDLEGLIPKPSSIFQQHLQNYRMSLSRFEPDFKLLRPIHRFIEDEALLSTVIHHEACLDVRNDIHYGGQLHTLNPDWFRDMIETINRGS